MEISPCSKFGSSVFRWSRWSGPSCRVPLAGVFKTAIELGVMVNEQDFPSRMLWSRPSCLFVEKPLLTRSWFYTRSLDMNKITLDFALAHRGHVQ